MTQMVTCTNIGDLNKKPVTALATVSPTVIEEIAWTKEQLDEAELVGHEPILDPELMQSQPEIKIEAKPVEEKPNLNAIGMLTFGKATELKKLFEAMKVLSDEVTINFSINNMAVRFMDPSRVAMIDYKISRDKFDEWSVSKSGICCFNVETILDKAFNKVNKDTYVKVEFNEKEITFTFKDQKERVRTFPLLESSEEEIPTPKLNFNVNYKVVAKTIKEDVEDLSKLSDHIMIVGDNDSLTLKVDGDLGKGQNKHRKGDECLLDVQVVEPSKATFSLSYLTGILKYGTALSDLMSIEYSNDMPIRLTFHSDFGDLYYYIAPRVQND